MGQQCTGPARRVDQLESKGARSAHAWTHTTKQWGVLVRCRHRLSTHAVHAWSQPRAVALTHSNEEQHVGNKTQPPCGRKLRKQQWAPATPWRRAPSTRLMCAAGSIACLRHTAHPLSGVQSLALRRDGQLYRSMVGRCRRKRDSAGTPTCPALAEAPDLRQLHPEKVGGELGAMESASGNQQDSTR